MTLTADERELAVALSDLERLAFEVHITPIQSRLRALVARIEARLDLPAGSIGTTHVIDGDAVTEQPNRGL